MKTVWAMALALVGLLSVSPVWGEGSEVASVAAAPDVVLLKDGSMFRGTISEKTPEGVEIVLVSGKVKAFTSDEIAYAGPDAERPSSSPSATSSDESVAAAEEDHDHDRKMVTVHAQEARLSLRSDPEGLTFHRRAASAQGVVVSGSHSAVARSVGYEEMCTAPCEVSMPSGTYTMALSEASLNPVEAKPVDLPPGDSTLTGDYKSKRGTRIAGTVIGLGGLALGTVVMLSGMDTDDPSTTSIYVGGAIMIGGVLIGLVLNSVPDEATIDVRPGPPKPERGRIARGVSFSGSF